MRAFVKTNNGTFPNLNFYLAWQAFTQMGVTTGTVGKAILMNTSGFLSFYMFERLWNNISWCKNKIV